MHARVCNSYVNPDDLEIVPERDYNGSNSTIRVTMSVTSNIVNPEPFLVPRTEIVERKRNRRILQHLVSELRPDVIKFNYT